MRWRKSVSHNPKQERKDIRKVLVVSRLDEECLRGQAGAVWQEFASNSAPCELVALGV